MNMQPITLARELWGNLESVLRQWKIRLLPRSKLARRIARTAKAKATRDANKLHREDMQEQGIWYDLKGLLESLSTYFKLIKHMRRADPDAYRVYKQIGGLVNYPERGFWNDLPAIWRDDASPAFGVTMMDTSGRDYGRRDRYGEKYMQPAFGYYRKVKPLAGLIEATEHDVFRCAMIFIDVNKPTRKKLAKKWNLLKPLTFVSSFYVEVTPAGDVRLLKEKQLVIVKPIKKRRSNKQLGMGRNASRAFHVVQFGYPRNVTMAYRDYIDGQKANNEEVPERNETVEEWITTLFRIIVSGHDQGGGGLMVRVKKDSDTAMFAIDLLRTPNFFQERELVVDATGHRKKIIHIVRTHKRVFADGRETYVKSHFRGMRRFQWYSYDVNVTMPGWHHNDPKNFTGPGHEFRYDTPVPDDMIDESEALVSIGAHLNR